MLATRDEAIQVAIARRLFVSRAVAAALAEVASAPACMELLANAGARLPRFSLDRIVERHGDDPEVRLMLLERQDLPLDLRHALLARLTASLRELVVTHDWLTPERAEKVMREARQRATIARAFEAPAESMPVLVEQLMVSGELTPAFLIRAAASAQTHLFEAALSALAAVPHQRVRALIASGRVSSLRALLQKAGLPVETHQAFAAAIDVIRRRDPATDASSDYRRASQLIDTIVTRYQDRPDRELDQILALLRQFAAEAKRLAAREYAQQVREAA
jgi:uncharacterized protein (DUF2336 family)